nr:zinc finger, CCHC-type [Tanacetum cinerariifolium]
MIFVGYAENSKAFRFFVIEPNESVSINSIIESKDAIFDENIFSLVSRPSLRIPNRTKDIGGSVVPKEVVQQPEPEFRKSKRNRTPKSFRPEFLLYLIKGTRDEKESINDEMDFIKSNNTWVLANLSPSCKPLVANGSSKKLKVDGTIKNVKERLVIHDFRQKSGIDYFDTYASVPRISTIRLLIAMELIHNLIIHEMYVKTTFLNGKLEDEVYMNQPQGFIMPGNENNVCKLIKSLYGLKQAPNKWHQKFDEENDRLGHRETMRKKVFALLIGKRNETLERVKLGRFELGKQLRKKRRLPVHWDKTAIVVTNEVRVNNYEKWQSGSKIADDWKSVVSTLTIVQARSISYRGYRNFYTELVSENGRNDAQTEGGRSYRLCEIK